MGSHLRHECIRLWHCGAGIDTPSVHIHDSFPVLCRSSANTLSSTANLRHPKARNLENTSRLRSGIDDNLSLTGAHSKLMQGWKKQCFQMPLDMFGHGAGYIVHTESHHPTLSSACSEVSTLQKTPSGRPYSIQQLVDRQRTSILRVQSSALFCCSIRRVQFLSRQVLCPL